jgi:hypothetical protein
MHRLLGVVFGDEPKANEGKETLLQLEAEGRIIIHGYALVAKHSDGNAKVSYADDHRPYFAFAGAARNENVPFSGEATALGLAAAGLAPPRAPRKWDISRISGIIDDVKKVMLPNRVALVADIEEDLPIAVDTRMESRGGTVFRWTLEG